MGFIIHPLGACHACLSLGLNKIGTRHRRPICQRHHHLLHLQDQHHCVCPKVSDPFLCDSKSGWASGTDHMWVGTIGIPSSSWLWGCDILTDWGGWEVGEVKTHLDLT